jgi:molybdopterin molybdotransferase
MIEFSEAYETVMNSAFNTGTEVIAFTGSTGRVLAGDVTSDMDLPPFNKSTVDGFACRRSDLGFELEVLETIAAGRMPLKAVSPGQCSRIMTGAAVPEGSDMVFMVEDSEVSNLGRVRFKGIHSKDNIAFSGEDVKSGDTVLNRGRLIKPQDIPAMASVGCTSLTVSRMPLVSVISTGDELVEPFDKPGPSQIRNSNAYQLLEQITQAGATGTYLGIARDDEDATYDLIRHAISQSDIVLITGGVSMGDFDFVPSVLERAGVRIKFSKIKIQPGKPTTFGVHPDALVFGLPGNPVSAFLQFEMLVKPLIYKMMNCSWKPFTFPLPMNETYFRRSADREALIPVIITDKGTVSPVEYHGSAHISALIPAQGIISLPSGKLSIEKGEIVNVRQI